MAVYKIRGVRFIWGSVVALGLLWSVPSLSQQAWVTTGSGAKVTEGVKDYVVSHEIASLAPGSTRESVIAAVVDKRLSWSIRREIPCSRLQPELRAALTRNGATVADATTFVASCSGTSLKARSAAVIRFDAATHTTSLWIEGMGLSTVQGDAFMRSAWSVWLGTVEDPALAAALTAKL